jgi:hypothetical protein
MSTKGLVVAALSAVLFTLVTPCAFADGGSLIPNLSPAKGPADIGVIFNTDGLLLGLKDYQAGVGLKIGWGKVGLRGLFAFTINGSSQTFAGDLGLTVEYHLVPGPVSPYVGASITGGYITQTNISSTLSFSAGAVAGVEVFILDFLSVFAEYSLVASLTNTTDLQSTQSTFDYLVNTAMGNSAQIGIVIYFMRSQGKSK